ncbi:acyl carrier protein [Streptomyces sp. 21So2-11]|uniref:acyl carrier protein n=1 Tax=Streptomyces sp. 21So2-11 TaxID=3144408 RepID=UPI00321934E9
MTIQQEAPIWDFGDWEEDEADESLLGAEIHIPERETLAGLPERERTRIVEAFVRRELARVLGMAPYEVETFGLTMSALGVGSVAGLQIQSRLQSALDVEVNLQMLLLANSAGELIDCLAGQLGPGDSPHARRSRRPA